MWELRRSKKGDLISRLLSTLRHWPRLRRLAN
jgi:hypothetical protein